MKAQEGIEKFEDRWIYIYIYTYNMEREIWLDGKVSGRVLGTESGPDSMVKKTRERKSVPLMPL